MKSVFLRIKQKYMQDDEHPSRNFRQQAGVLSVRGRLPTRHSLPAQSFFSAHLLLPTTKHSHNHQLLLRLRSLDDVPVVLSRKVSLRRLPGNSSSSCLDVSVILLSIVISHLCSRYETCLNIIMKLLTVSSHLAPRLSQSGASISRSYLSLLARSSESSLLWLLCSCCRYGELQLSTAASPFFAMTTGPLHWELMFRQRAVDNQVYTIGAAPARDLNAGYHSWGHSIAADPWGKVLMEMEEKPDVEIVELDLDEVKKVREQLPLLKHRREDIYALTTFSL